MRITFITDLHGCHEYLPLLPSADLLLIGGDLTQFGSAEDVSDMLNKLRQQNKSLLAVLGNLDPPRAEEKLRQENCLLTLSPVTFAHLRLAGLGGANITPFQTPYEWRDEEMDVKLKEAFPAAGQLDLLVSHAPPLRSGADLLGNGVYAGSNAVAQTARRLQLPMVLCGHIHEADGIFDLHGTMVVNPGPFAEQGKYACIDWQENAKPTVWLGKCANKTDA